MKRKGWVSASYTVEASAVLPVLLGLWLFCVLFLFFFHDRLLLQAEIIGKGMGTEVEGIYFLFEEAALEEAKEAVTESWPVSAKEMPDFLRLFHMGMEILEGGD